MTKTCPHCNGTNTSEIVYGLPAPEFLLKPKKVHAEGARHVQNLVEVPSPFLTKSTFSANL